MARDIARIQLPIPTATYDPLYERNRNGRIEDLIRSRASVDELAPYGGVPHAALSGTDAAFSTPGLNVITILPFNVILASNPDLLVAGQFQFAFKMDIGWWMQLQHIDGAGGNTSFTFYLYRNGVLVKSVTEDIALGNDDSFNRMFFAQVMVPNEAFDFRVSHSASQPMIFDMTRSQVWVEQLTPNPAYTQSDTRP